MTAPSDRYTARALVALVTTTVIYMVMNGAQIFETVTVVPRWAEDPPASVEKLLRGPSALDFQTFWISMHTLHELSFLAAIALCWRLRRLRFALLGLFAVHLAIRIWTVAYFAPTIIMLERGTLPEPAELLGVVATWETLNHVRVAGFVLVSLALVPLVARLARAHHTGTPVEPAVVATPAPA